MRLGLTVVLALLCVVPHSVLAQTPVSATPTAVSVFASEIEPNGLDERVEETLASMSVADRVGQLFLITFDGNDAGFDSDIAELIYGYRVGGVVLKPSSGNFSNETGEDTPRQVASLTNRLQGLAYGVLLPAEGALQALPDMWPTDSDLLLEEMTDVAPVNLPLFIGVKQLGDNLPETKLRRGFTPLPSQMAIGASWNPGLAREVGRIVGSELRAVGVNLLLGPNLDVLDQPRPDPVGRLGLHMFGGDPYWVGQLGKAYVAGVHEGSGNQVATVAGHFPGAGDMDRLPDEEVSTIQRPLAELEQIALPPFQDVTADGLSSLSSESDPGITDGMMSSLARYSAFQGSSLGRNTPIGLAPELKMVLEEHGFGAWRAQGGLLVSGELGAPAVRRHYAQSPAEFPFRRIALDAFTAGHDLLYLGRFSSDGAWESQRLNIKETIGFFQERYVDDPDFAQEVDARVRRILRLKLRLYDSSPAESATTAQVDPAIPVALRSTLVQETDLDSLRESHGNSLASVGQVARESITILYPDPREAYEVLSRTPQAGEKILIITDSRLEQECEDCMVDVSVAPDEIEEIILRLYGPGATDQLVGDEITSLTFTDLEELLDAEEAVEVEGAEPATAPIVIPTVTPAPLPTPERQPEANESDQAEAAPVAQPQPVDGSEDDGLDKNAKNSRHIQEADWVLFAMLDVDEELYPQSDVVKRFLRQHSDDLASKVVVVFALNAPYFLDATEISKLNAYYGVYGKTDPFLENAVRALFRSFTPDAAPPVGVGGTRFSSLAERLSPDPDRSIYLGIATADGDVLAESDPDDGIALPAVDNGTILQLQAGPVLDRNGNPVGDGELVQFVLTYDGDESAQRLMETTTRSGMAARELQIDQAGLLEVVARAGEATSGEPLQISVQGEALVDSGATTESAPPTADESVENTEAVAMNAPVEAAAAAPDAVDPAVDIGEGEPINLASLVISLLTIMIMVSMLVIVQVRIMPRRALVHSILWAVNCGLLAYILYGFGLIPGAGWLQTSLRIWGAAIVVFVAMLLPLLWLQLRPER